MRMSWIRRGALATWLCVCALALQACAGNAEPAPSPSPAPSPARESAGGEVNWRSERLQESEDGTPVLAVHVVDAGEVEHMDVETYVQGVLAGEMKNDWPMEALKAQAILARTFVLKFVQEKESRYEGAAISTDIEEAQAYDADAVNERIRQAVEETRGEVLSANGELPYAWFHAHSGGVTELAKPGLGWEKEEPAYTLAAAGNEPENVTDEADAQTLKDAQEWEASFPYAEFEAACAKQGVDVSLTDGAELAIGERGESGRAVTLMVDGQSVRAPELRIALGSTKMRSTALTSLRAEGGEVRMAGKGYGHGVGMSQWGAYGMAEAGESAEEIVTHYFKDVEVMKIW